MTFGTTVPPLYKLYEQVEIQTTNQQQCDRGQWPEASVGQQYHKGPDRFVQCDCGRWPQVHPLSRHKLLQTVLRKYTSNSNLHFRITAFLVVRMY